MGKMASHRKTNPSGKAFFKCIFLSLVNQTSSSPEKAAHFLIQKGYKSADGAVQRT